MRSYIIYIYLCVSLLIRFSYMLMRINLLPTTTNLCYAFRHNMTNKNFILNVFDNEQDTMVYLCHHRNQLTPNSQPTYIVCTCNQKIKWIKITRILANLHVVRIVCDIQFTSALHQ